MLKKLALVGAMVLALSVPSWAACPSSQLGNVSGQNAIALQTVAEAECAHLATIAAGAGGATIADTNIKQVNGSTVATGHGTASGSVRVELPTDGTGKVGLNAGSAIVGSVGIDQTTSGTTNAVVPLATENHVGEVGNNQITITVAQTVTASSAYTAGNAVGGLITFSGAARVSGSAGAAGTSGLVQSVTVNSKSAQTTQMDLVLFSANPTGSTCADKTALSVAVADFDKVIGTAHITDWTSLGTPSVGQSQNLAMPYALASSTTLYGCLVTRATPTFTATTDISASLRVIRN